MKNYHCCATCRHFAIVREHDKIQPRCTRLGYDTKTHYQFHCWDPRPDIAEKMKQQSVESPSSQEGSEHEGQAGG